MTPFRMLRIAWRLSWPHVFTPWRSPLLRWRLETYGVTDAQGHLLHAEQVTAPVFWRFAWQRRRNLWSFLRWAAELPPAVHQRHLSQCRAVIPGRWR